MPSVVAYTGLQQQVLGDAQEAAASSANDWYKGDLLAADTSGELVIATAGVIESIALKAATGTASTKIPRSLININEIYVVKHTTSITGETMIGDCFDFTFTAGAHVVADGGTTDVYCVGLHPDDGAKISGRLLVRFLYSIFTATAT